MPNTVSSWDFRGKPCLLVQEKKEKPSAKRVTCQPRGWGGHWCRRINRHGDYNREWGVERKVQNILKHWSSCGDHSGVSFLKAAGCGSAFDLSVWCFLWCLLVRLGWGQLLRSSAHCWPFSSSVAMGGDSTFQWAQPFPVQGHNERYLDFCGYVGWESATMN